MNSDNDAKHSSGPDGTLATKQATKIRIIEDAEATGETAAAYDFWRAGSGRQQVPGIMKCFGSRPDFLRRIIELGNTIHFSEGHLSRRHKEMIASYVSFLNRCPYWLDSHAYFLRVQGASDQCVRAIVEGKLDEAGLTAAERALLEYVELITGAAYRSTPENVEKLRVAGWKEEEISEAVYITALFAFFNRVADAFGVPSQDYLGTGKWHLEGINSLWPNPLFVIALHSSKALLETGLRICLPEKSQAIQQSMPSSPFSAVRFVSE